jgi:hypothetical protein
MGRPLNMDEVTWLKSEIERLKGEGSGGDDKAEKLKILLQGLYDAHVQCEGYDPNNPAVQEVQRELGII